MVGVSAYGTTVGAAPAGLESSPGASPEALETRVARPRAAGYPKITGLPRDPRLAVADVVRCWPAKPLGRTPSAPLVDRVLDRPLHAEPFAGALEIDGRLLLVSGGFVVGAVGPDPDASCDAVCEDLPET